MNVGIFGHVIFGDMGATALLMLALIYFTAFFIKGLFGAGSMPPLIIFGAWILEPHESVIVAVITNAITQFQFMTDMRREADWKIARPLALSFACFVILGVWIFSKLSGSELTIALGIGLGGTIAAEHFGLLTRLAARLRTSKWTVGLWVGGVAGLLAGATGAGGIVLLSLFIKMILVKPAAIRATVLLIATVALVWRVIVFGVGGFITIQFLLESLLLLPVAIFGAFLGSKSFYVMRDDRFPRFFTLILMVAAASLLWRGVFETFVG
jgi:uncharacterized membrane protein YfcA